jgi:TrpR-related protein YerC/YecD
MAKFPRYPKISKEEQDELLIWLCEAVANLKNKREAAEFLKDILSRQEAEMIARRLKTAQLLIEGLSYGEISHQLKISPSTIAKINEWIKLSGNGYRMVLERMNQNKEKGNSIDDKYDYYSWRNVKRRYPAYFWPQLLLESVISSAREADKKKIKAVLGKMDKKSKLFKQLNKHFTLKEKRG